MDLGLAGKTALVSGSYRGTGLVIARHLAAEGVRVFVHGLAPGQAERAVAEIGSGEPVTGDITCSAVIARSEGEPLTLMEAVTTDAA